MSAETDLDLHDEAPTQQVVDRHLMLRLLRYVLPHKRLAGGAVGLIILSSVLELVGPLVTALALDLFVRPLGGEPAESTLSRLAASWLSDRQLHIEPVAGITYLAAIWALAIGLGFIVQYLQGYTMQWMGQRIMFDLRRQVFAQLQRLQVSFFDRQPVGRLVTRATTDIAALNELFTAGLVSIFGDVVLLVGIVGVLFVLDWRLALVSFAVLPLLALLTLWFKTRVRHSYRRVRVKIARINAFLQEHISGMQIVQLFNAERRALRDFSNINAKHRDANVKAIFYYAVYYPAVELVTALGLALIVWYGGGQTVRGALSIGALVAFMQYAQRFYQPLADLSEKYNILQGAMASAERIFELLDSEIDIEQAADPYRPAVVRGDIQLESVDFSYLAGEPVLRNVSLDIAAGETVAIVGHTGAGKSTLANLLLRFYDVDVGAVRVDGVDVRDWHVQRLRRSIAMVLQDVFLFAGNVADNIRLGDDEIDDERLRRAAREVQALDFIERLPDGFDTRVRERGAGLSVGQKQLISFARALAYDPEILILDEATASIDSETEQRIQLALDRLLQHRTSLVIAHRLSTIQKADRIIVMHKGEIREQGSHDQLIARRGIYHKLYRLQFEPESADARISTPAAAPAGL